MSSVVTMGVSWLATRCTSRVAVGVLTSPTMISSIFQPVSKIVHCNSLKEISMLRIADKKFQDKNYCHFYYKHVHTKRFVWTCSDHLVVILAVFRVVPVYRHLSFELVNSL